MGGLVGPPPPSTGLGGQPNNPYPANTPGVATLPDGTPNFGVAAGGSSASGSTPVDPTGALNIWNIPSEISGQMIWFDTGHRKVTTGGGPIDYTGSGDVNVLNPTPPSKPTTHREAHEILRSPTAIMKQFAAMSFNDPQKFLALQKALAMGPWGTVYATGAFDSHTESALANAMVQYVKLSAGAGVGISFTDYLLQTGARAQSLGGDGTSAGSGGSTAAPFQPQLTDPAEIRAAAQQAFQAAVGKGATSAQLDAFVAQFQAAQKSAELANYKGKGTITMPELTSQAGAYAQQQDPKAYANYKQQSYVDALVNMFAPSGSQRPSASQPVPTAQGG